MAAQIQYQAADYILSALSVIPTAANVNLLVAWMPWEFTPAELAVTNNPMATSQNAPGQVGYCTLPNGERSSEPCYDTLAHGATACAMTLQNGRYPHLLAGLQNSDPATFFSTAGMSELSTWCGGCNYGPKIQTTYNSLPTPPSWALSATTSGGIPNNPPALSKALLWGGLGLAGIGVIILGYELWSSARRPIQGFARRRNDDGHTDAKIDPQWLTFIKTTDKEVAEIAKSLSACDAYKNLLAATERAGVRVLPNRNLPEGVNAMYLPPNPDLPQMPEGRIMLSTATTQGAKECNPYDVQTVAHEDTHYLDHKPDCMPHFRGMQYSSEGHQIEEREAELASFAFMVESGLPVETYEGTYYPAGTEEIDWGLAKRNLHPDTYENVKWATGLLVRAGQGDVDAFVDATCPFARKSA